MRVRIKGRWHINAPEIKKLSKENIQTVRSHINEGFYGTPIEHIVKSNISLFVDEQIVGRQLTTRGITDHCIPDEWDTPEEVSY